MTTFLMHWFWYLVAFGLGSLVALVAARRVLPATNADEAFADLPESYETGDGR